ncbi:MAG TPA: glycosyltransferase family 2 protein [Gemmatimonadota bacterium]|nr:glycosyltransferase family 2 protein [Gemmatimonadota bacterium]
MNEGSRPRLSVVVPIKDEVETLPELTRRLFEVLTGDLANSEVVFVDDGSSDGSARWIAERHAEDPRVKLVRLSRNFGHQAAVTAGLAHAAGGAVVLMDGDLQDPPELIPALVERWREGNEIVHTVKTRRQESWPRRVAFRGFYRIIRALSSETDLPLQAGLFSLLDRRVVDELQRMPERNRYLAGLRSWVGFRQSSIEYERDARWSGAPRVSVARLFRLAFDGIFSFSNLPLRLATLLGLVVSLAAFLLMATILYLRLFTDRAILGWASLMTSILFLGGVILVTIGIIGEYTGRIYDEVKRRPMYIVAERVGIEPRPERAEDRRF